VVEQRAHVLDVGERPSGERGFSEAAEVGPDDEPMLGERVDLTVPEPPVADPSV